jgi:exopolyphosphatase / guanosine-5'-triphosphate,3'-diphosphate pyrophosphatase
VRVGVVDIGSNTARLLVADVRGDVAKVARRRAYLGLGAEIAATGTLSAATIERAAALAAAYVERAERAGARVIETVVTAPGRQAAHGESLCQALHRATGSRVRLLDADEEARLAFAGAIAAARRELPGVVAAVDVGGGSSELAVGTPLVGATWTHSLDLGSLRLRELVLAGDPPGAKRIARARALVADSLADIEPPRPGTALAVGGSARGAARIVGPRLGPEELGEVVRIASKQPARALELFHLHPHRARTLLAGAVLLEGYSTMLARPLELGRGGVREGVALQLARHAAVAA